MTNFMNNKSDKEKEEIKELVEKIIDYLPTDLKYNHYVEEFLIETLGHGFTTEEEEKHYKEIDYELPRNDGVPNQTLEEDITVWQAEKLLYDASLAETYPEAYDKGASKMYTILKSSRRK